MEAKVILLPKNSKAPLTGSNIRPISLLPTLSIVAYGREMNNQLAGNSSDGQAVLFYSNVQNA